jgi:L-alanine-DL-glutamate epimerase-like enolase superfamily enzyme
MTEVFQLNFFLLSTNTTRMGGVPLLGYVLLSWNPEDLRALDQEESPSIPCTFDVREATVAERAALEAAVWDGHAKMQGDE